MSPQARLLHDGRAGHHRPRAGRQQLLSHHEHADPPQVKSVGLAQVNGLDLAYTAGMGQGSAAATKNGNSYKITGTGTGTDTSAGMQMVTKPFEIDVTCP